MGDENGSQEGQEVPELQMGHVAGSGTPPRFVWSPELTSAFISLRSTHEELFTKRRNSASHGYSIILQKLAESGLVEDNTLTPRQLRKKWENLLKRYRKLKHTINASGYCSSDISYETWPHYKDMDQILAKHEPLTHMLLSEPLSNQGFDYSEDYPMSAKRFRSDSDNCPPIQLVETSTQTQQASGQESSAHRPQQQKQELKHEQDQNTDQQGPQPNLPSCSRSVKPECDGTVVIPRSEVLQQLLVLHERFISIYERLVIALENATD